MMSVREVKACAACVPEPLRAGPAVWPWPLVALCIGMGAGTAAFPRLGCRDRGGWQGETLSDRAPVQGEWGRGGWRYQPGTISWEEHEVAWRAYDAKWGCGQSAERIAERGGFGYDEIVKLLGREPTTWQSRLRPT